MTDPLMKAVERAKSRSPDVRCVDLPVASSGAADATNKLEATATTLSKPQIAALKELSPVGFRVGWQPKLSWPQYQELRERGLIEERWTWASTTRPDVRISELGIKALKEIAT